MALTARHALVTLALCAALSACGGGDDAPDTSGDDTAEVSWDGSWAGTMDESGGEVTFTVDGDELEGFEAVIPHCDPGYTEDKAFTIEEFEIAADGTVSSTVEDEYAGLGSTMLTLDGAFDGADSFAGTLLWQSSKDCDSGELAFTAQRQ